MSVPTLVTALSSVKVRKISAGCEHSAAIDEAGVLYTWGCGDGGRLGHGDNASISIPMAVYTLKDMLVR